MDAACGETYKLLLLSCNCLGLKNCTMKASTQAVFRIYKLFSSKRIIYQHCSL